MTNPTSKKFPERDYLEINRTSWNEKTDIHYNSKFYDVQGFINGKSSLKSIELDLLGEIKNKTLLHLQCHFGQDTISLARMGAQCTGIDFSDRAILKARELAKITKTDAQFVLSDIYNLPNQLSEQFDIVFTSYGVIGWLPDIEKWADIVVRYMKPDGIFVFVEFHPVLWMFDDNFKHIEYNYFNDGPISEEEVGTYAEKESEVSHRYMMWNHSMSSVVEALLKRGLRLETLREYDYSPYDCVNEMKEVEPGKFRIKHLEDKIPMVYALRARKT